MNMFSGILGNVVGAVLGGSRRGAPMSPLGSILSGHGGGAPIQSGMLLSAALMLIQRNGGLDGVLAKLRQSGLGTHADSWVGTGGNLPIAADQLQQVLGDASGKGGASPMGLSMGDSSNAMAAIVPELINQLTPQGQIPPNHADLIAKAVAMLKGAGA